MNWLPALIGLAIDVIRLFLKRGPNREIKKSAIENVRATVRSEHRRL